MADRIQRRVYQAIQKRAPPQRFGSALLRLGCDRVHQQYPEVHRTRQNLEGRGGMGHRVRILDLWLQDADASGRADAAVRPVDGERAVGDAVRVVYESDVRH